MSPTTTRIDPPSVYLDTSAYLAVLLGEKEAPVIMRKLRDKVLCSSTLLLLESERTLIHLVRQKVLPPEIFDKTISQLKSDRDVFMFRDLTLDLCLGLDFPAVRTPRSSDLAHLRTAKWFINNGGLLFFLSIDKDQIKAAYEMSIPLG